MKLLHVIFIDNAVVRFVDKPIISMTIPPLAGFYFVALDVFGEKWDWIKNNIDIHSIIFSSMIFISIVILFLQGINRQYRNNFEENYNKIVDEFIFLINSLVKKKKDRFYKRAQEVKKNGDTFKLITQPKEQIVHAMDCIRDFLVSSYAIEKKNIEITIIRGDEASGNWWYEFSCDLQKQYTKAKELMQNSSIAKYCKETGESLFLPDLRKGIKENIFYETKRSKNFNNEGSVYCRPIRAVLPGKVDMYIFTVIVYGKFLCKPYDEIQSRAVEKIFDEIGDRIELELYLFSMKNFKK